MNEELNKKIYKWLGFTIRDYPEPKCELNEEALFDPDGNFFGGLHHLPRFSHSLDACFKYVVPTVFKKDGQQGVEHLLDMWVNTMPDGCDLKEYALAFCKAVEKLIDA